MLNINEKLKESLKILKTSSGSSPGIDMSTHLIKLPYISRETVPLNSKLSFPMYQDAAH
jgi:hypothetical protein